MVDSLPLPDGFGLDTASWEHTPLVGPPLVAQLLASIPPQTARIQALEARMADLEARLQQRAHHADRPPSTDPPDETRPARAGAHGKPGATPGHPGHQPALLAPTEIIEVKPSAGACGQTACLDTSPYSTPQVIERPEIQMRVRHVVWDAACCPQCGRITKAQVPPEVRYGSGPRVTALIGELSGSQRDRRSAGQECCPAVLGVPISRGALQRAVDRVSEAIHRHDDAIAEKARQAQVHSIDETSWSQHGVLAWLWVMVNTTVAWCKVQARRSTVALDALVKRWAGILVSEGDGVYGPWVQGRQTCLAHRLRRARGLAERQDPELARVGHRVLTELHRLVHWATAPPTSGAVQTW